MEIQLRLVLLVVGVLILLVGGYDLYKRRERNFIREESLPEDAYIPEDDILSTVRVKQEDDKALDLIDDYVEYGETVQIEPRIVTRTVTAPVEIERTSRLPTQATPDIIAVSIMSRTSKGFNGAALYTAITSANLQFGKGDIFYRYADNSANNDGEPEVLFCLVKAVEPGYFFLDLLKDEFVPGVTLIMQVNRVRKPEYVLDRLIRTAKQMAYTLNGELLDAQRKPLTWQSIEEYRMQVREYV